MKIKLQIPDVSILITIAAATLPIVFRNLGREAGSFAFLWAPLTLLVILFKRPAIFTKESIGILFLYGLIMVGILQYTLWNYMDDWNRPRILLEFYFLIVGTAVLYYYLVKGEFRKLAWLSMWTFIFITITLIGTNIALFFDPTIVRQSASTEYFTSIQEKVYKHTGAMGYSYGQSLVCLIPILIYHIKKKKKMVFAPKVLLAILALLIITQLRAQVFANILVTVMITILAIIGSKKRWVSNIAILSFSVMIFIIPKSFYTNSLVSLSHSFDSESDMYYKLNDFAEFIENPELDVSTGTGSRAERYPLLLNALAANPLVGDASHASNFDIGPGAHLYWMNRLALWGLPGFLFFIFTLFRIYRSINSLFDAEYSHYYLLSVIALIMLGLIKAVGGSEPWLILIVVVPGLYFLPLLQQTKKDKAFQKANVTSIPANRS